MATVEGLFANLAPIKVGGKTDFGSTFTRCLGRSSQALVCTGYVAAESLIELERLVRVFTNLKEFRLIVGMARFDGLTREQLQSLKQLNQTLHELGLGDVQVAIGIPIHSKISLFTGESRKCILGSSNLGSLTRATRQYEVDVLIENDEEFMDDVQVFMDQAIEASSSLNNVASQIKIVVSGPHPLDNLSGVTKVESGKHPQLGDLTFELPVSIGDKSGINAFFGKGRKSVDNRTVPRPWYEAELIVSKTITSLLGYPGVDVNGGKFKVITDDGYSFDCNTSGDYSKNLRSDGDLETLGRWIKGRLERAGALEMGQPATETTLAKYGRSSIQLTCTSEPNVWFMDFGVRPHD